MFKTKACIRTADLWYFGQCRINTLDNEFGPSATSTDEIDRHLVTVFKHCFQDMGRRERLVAFSQRERLGTLNDRACTLGVLFDIHYSSPSKGRQEL